MKAVKMTFKHTGRVVSCHAVYILNLRSIWIPPTYIARRFPSGWKANYSPTHDSISFEINSHAVWTKNDGEFSLKEGMAIAKQRNKKKAYNAYRWFLKLFKKYYISQYKINAERLIKVNKQLNKFN